MTRRSLNQGSDVIAECPFCEHITEVRVLDKTTERCTACSRPYEIYEDGRSAPSYLYFVRGRVTDGPLYWDCLFHSRPVRTLWDDI